MFDFASEPLPYTDPWDVGLAQRLQMFRAGDFRVAYYYTHPDNSTFRYRCFNMVKTINELLPGVSSSWFCAGDDDWTLRRVISEADLLVLGRNTYSSRVAAVVQTARRWGKTVLYDCDDYVFDISTVPDIVETLDLTRMPDMDEVWSSWFGWIARYRAVLDLCDGLIVTNEYLADRSRNVVDMPIAVVPNFMGAEQISYSEELLDARLANGSSHDDTLSIGYFSGSPSHNRDFSLAAEALRTLLVERPSLRLRIVGFLDLAAGPLAGMEDRIDVSPLVNYLELQRLIAQTEVNIAPLQVNMFTNCKSELKYFDAAAVGVPTIASPTFAMSRAITSGVNGIICSDYDWYRAIRALIDDYDTVALPMGKTAHDDAVSRYCGKAMLPQIVQTLGIPA